MVNKKIVKRGTEARNLLIEGANFLADCVKDTLGPWGANFFLEKGHRISNDGVSVASEVQMDNEINEAGVFILREAATKTNDKVGDGTTTAIVLAQAILKEAVRFLGDDQKGIVAKKSGSEVVKQIQTEKEEVITKLVSMSTPIETEQDLINSARVSVESDELGELIGKAQWELGKDGVLIAEETTEKGCSIERVPGVRIDSGLGASIVINNQEKQSLELQNIPIFITNHTIQTILPLKNLYDYLAKQGVRQFAIMARAFTSEAIKECMQNTEAGFSIYPINAPYQDQVEVMQDLSAVLGATFCNVETSSLEDMNVSDIGFAKEIIAKRWEARFIGQDNEETKKRVEERLAKLKEQLAGHLSDFEQRNLRQRIAQLTNGLSVVKVGGISETERKYRKDKIDDAVNAVRVAFQEGTVKGAGLAFKEIADDLADTYILKRPLLSLYEQIKSTAPADFIVPEWVRDPVKVLRVALEEACDVAGRLATCKGASVAEKPKSRVIEVKD